MRIIRGLLDTPAGYCHLMWEGCSSWCSSFECTCVALRAGSHPADRHLRTPSRHQALRICAAIAGRDGGTTKKGMRVMTAKANPRPLPPLGEVRSYPVLPLRDIVVFPHMIVPLFVGREKSIRALEEVMRSDVYILLATQKNASDDDPVTDSIYEVGTLASVLQLLKLPDGTVKVLVEGAVRARVLKYSDRTDYYEAEATVVADEMGEKDDAEAIARSVVIEYVNYIKLNKKM